MNTKGLLSIKQPLVWPRLHNWVASFGACRTFPEQTHQTTGDKKGHEVRVASLVLPGSVRGVWAHGGELWVEPDVCMMPKTGDLGRACVSQALNTRFLLSLCEYS